MNILIMKKNFIYILSLLLILSCKDEYNTDINIPMTNIYLSLPLNGANVDLNNENEEFYEFSWDKPSESGSLLIFSTTKDLVEQVTIDAGTGTNCRVKPIDLNLLFSNLGIKSGDEKLLYWTVKHKDNQKAASSEVREILVKRMISNLVAPEDMAKCILLADAPNTNINFEWDTSALGKDTECSLLFSLDPEMNNSVEFVRKGTSKIEATHEELQQTIEKLPIKRYSTNIVYWNVRNNTDNTFVSRATNLIYLNDMMRLVDKRGDETRVYPVVRINFSDGTSQVWTAKNMNTTKYPDGSEIESEYYKYAPESVGEEWKDAIGVYYSFVIRDKIIPEGWRLPTKNEWNFLFQEAGKDGGYNVLKDPIYYYKDPTGQENLNKWGLGFCSAGGWNVDSDKIEFAQEKFYFMASDFGDPTTWTDPWRALIHDGSDTLWESWAKGTVMRYIYVE